MKLNNISPITAFVVATVITFTAVVIYKKKKASAAVDEPGATTPDKPAVANAKLKGILDAAVADPNVGQISKHVVDAKNYYSIIRKDVAETSGGAVKVYDSAGTLIDTCNASIAPDKRSAFCNKLYNANSEAIYRADKFLQQAAIPFAKDKVNFSGIFMEFPEQKAYFPMGKNYHFLQINN